MTASDVVQQMVECWNLGDRAGYMACGSPGVMVDKGQSCQHGWELPYDLWHRAMPDCRLQIKCRVQQDAYCAAEILFTGTHTARLEVPKGFGVTEVQPTGRTVEVLLCGIYHAEGDHIDSANLYGWMSPVLLQLGAVGEVVVPDVVNHTREQALAILEQVGLHMAIPKHPGSADDILEQYPSAGISVPTGSTVTVILGGTGQS